MKTIELRKAKSEYRKELNTLRLKWLARLLHYPDVSNAELAEIFGITEGQVRYLKGKWTTEKKEKENV